MYLVNRLPVVVYLNCYKGFHFGERSYPMNSKLWEKPKRIHILDKVFVIIIIIIDYNYLFKKNEVFN